MDVSKVGGKGAGLIWLAQNTDLGYKVPEFEIIDASFYEDFIRQQKVAQFDALLHTIATGKEFRGLFNPRRFGTLEEKCTELSEKFKGRAIAVRSSAVVSEDSDEHSGAGLYDTHFLGGRQQKPVTPQNLFDAVLKVYSSVNNPAAVRYRKENNLGEERMAVIVQEMAQGYNGVAFSRMPWRKDIVPVSWSWKTGAVVGSSSYKDIQIAHFAYRGDKADMGREEKKWETIFSKDFNSGSHVEAIRFNFLPLIYRIRKRYGREFDLEFSLSLPSNPYAKSSDLQKHNLDIKLLQIRPLTNINDNIVRFPHRKAIFEANNVMGAGEYIGPWAKPIRDVNLGWHEPEHYAFVAYKLEQSLPNLGTGLNLNEITPNKRAIILTGPFNPGTHALTIAHERSILCLIGDYGGESIFDSDNRNAPNYIHIVSDGLRAKVYEATWAQGANFAKKHGLPEPKYIL